MPTYWGGPFEDLGRGVHRLDAWAQRIGSWQEDGLEEFHLLVHQPDSVHTPETSRQFARLVQARAGLKVQAPVDVADNAGNATLFSGL